jgi:hypothetical protein
VQTAFNRRNSHEFKHHGAVNSQTPAKLATPVLFLRNLTVSFTLNRTHAQALGVLSPPEDADCALVRRSRQ